MTKGIKIAIYSVLGVSALVGGFMLYKKIKKNNDDKKLANLPLTPIVETPITDAVSPTLPPLVLSPTLPPLVLSITATPKIKGTRNQSLANLSTAPAPSQSFASANGSFGNIVNQYQRPTWVV